MSTERGNKKLKIQGNYLGKNIFLYNSEENVYMDDYGYKYLKRNKNLIVKYEINNIPENFLIEDFQEGDYGLWIEEKAPYYYEAGKIIRTSTREEMEEGELKGIEENQYLWDENRIVDDFLWISKNDKIKMTLEEETEEEQGNSAVSTEENTEEESIEANEEGTQEKERESYVVETNPFEAMADLKVGQPKGGGSLIVVQGAMCMCSGGTAPGTLSVTSNSIMKVEGKMVATIADAKMPNITPMGACRPRAGRRGIPPCSMKPAGDWKCPDGGFDINGKQVLTQNGIL